MKKEKEEQEEGRFNVAFYFLGALCGFDCEYYHHHSYYAQRASQATALCFIVFHNKGIFRFTKVL